MVLTMIAPETINYDNIVSVTVVYKVLDKQKFFKFIFKNIVLYVHHILYFNAHKKFFGIMCKNTFKSIEKNIFLVARS